MKPNLKDYLFYTPVPCVNRLQSSHLIKNSSKVNAAGQCWIIKPANFNCSIHYKPGAQNVVTDALSQFPIEN